jgi:outer membrane receptor protein involved in Fe transport
MSASGSLAVLLTLATCTPVFAQQAVGPGQIVGIVLDESGAAVTGADVLFTSGPFKADTHTDESGRFAFEDLAAPSGTITVTMRGFETATRSWKRGQKGEIRIVLEPSMLSQQITVTASRTAEKLVETPSSVVVLTPADLQTSAALSLDGDLRQVPGFTLFRRTDSRTANPTSQGVSLRGLGASGASRALLISDGIPVNDPFGGWVYWDEVPVEAISSVEVASGGASPLYGTTALGGVINVIRRDISQPTFTLETSYGNENTPYASLLGSERVGKWVGAVDADLFHTHGYIPVPPEYRGTVDTFANSEHASGDITVERILSNDGRIFVRGSGLGEYRDNGTFLQTNSTTIRQVDAGANWRSDTAGVFSVVAYGGLEHFDQSFSAISLDRNTETLTDLQRVPVQQVGLSGQWSRPLKLRHTLVAGVDTRDVRGDSQEQLLLASALTDAGGRQRNLGFFAEDVIRVTGRFLLTIGGRLDRWRNFDAFSNRQSLTSGTFTQNPLPERSESFFSPRLGVVYKLTEKLSLTGSGYRSFRAPTLNELYRGFRLGNILTLPNSQLVAERLTGGEGGAIYSAFEQRMVVRGTFFWSEITRPIANVTLNTTPTLITDERDNLGRTRSAGVETEAEARLTNAVFVSAGYQFADAIVTSFPANPALVGLWIPQVPQQNITFQTRYEKVSLLTFAVQGRYVGDQFEDDLNTLKLRQYFTVDVFVSHAFTPSVEAFFAVENLLNQRYDIGRTPVLLVATPLLARAGVRLEFGHR